MDEVKNENLQIESENTDESIDSNTDTDNNSLDFNIKGSTVFLVATVAICIIGFIAGIVLGNTFKLTEIAYKYPTIQEDPYTVEVFNTPIMFVGWISAIIIAFVFLWFYYVLKNQETIIQEMKDLKSA